MHWLALHLPLLPLEAFCATLGPAEAARPIALVAQHRIAQVNPAAAQRGLRAGIKRATAQALAADLLLAESHPGREAAALLAVAHAALAFTPAVVLHDSQTVLLDAHSSLRLFGGAAALQRRLVAAVAPLGHHLQAAAAPTALGAALLAQWFPRQTRSLPNTNQANADLPPVDLALGPHSTSLQALQALLVQAPVWLLGPGREHWEALQGMGLHTLSDLLALPRSGLARRFGQDLLDELDRALGLQADPRTWVELPATFDARLELFARADTTDQVLHGASVLLARLVAWAQARQARVAAFTLRMLHEKARHAAPPATELRVELAEPALDAAHLQGLLRERLGRLELIAPTLDLQLHCSHLVAGHAPNGELFPTRASQTLGLTRLLERLRARLGDEQVLRLVTVADHRPECASRTVPAVGPVAGSAVGSVVGLHAGRPAGPGRLHTADALAAASAPALADSGLPLHRPAWLLSEPLPLAERDAMPWWQGRALQLVSGPERIETGWWDGASVARDYFIARAEDGCLVWVYRSRLPAASGVLGQMDEPTWHLQGLFA
jgi:protein ImuB